MKAVVSEHALSIFGLPADPKIPVFLCAFSEAEFHPSFFEDEAIACPPEIARSVRKRQAEYFHGRLCARSALASIGVADRMVGTGKSREPVWPDRIIGSITHNADLAAAVALRMGTITGVGIDIETVVTDASREAVIDTALTVVELNYLRGVTALEPDQLLTLVFSAKESFFKAVFGVVGRYFDFDAVAVTGIDSAARSISLLVVGDLCARFPVGSRIRAHYTLIDACTVFTSVAW